MRKVLIGMVAMTAAASASAQSSVTLYGIVDNGLEYETGMPKGHVFGAREWRDGPNQDSALKALKISVAVLRPFSTLSLASTPKRQLCQRQLLRGAGDRRFA